MRRTRLGTGSTSKVNYRNLSDGNISETLDRPSKPDSSLSPKRPSSRKSSKTATPSVANDDNDIVESVKKQVLCKSTDKDDLMIVNRHTCSVCNAKYMSATQLRKHMVSHTLAPVKEINVTVTPMVVDEEMAQEDPASPPVIVSQVFPKSSAGGASARKVVQDDGLEGGTLKDKLKKIQAMKRQKKLEMEQEMSVSDPSVTDVGQEYGPEGASFKEKLEYIQAMKKKRKLDGEQDDSEAIYGESTVRPPKKKSFGEKKVFTCDVCGRVVKSQWHLNNHKIAAHFVKNECTVCSKTFEKRCTLNRHMLSHTNERKYACHICLKAFRQPAHLKSHMISHVEERNYGCNMCTMAFKTEQHLIRHYMTHNTEPSCMFECKICHKSFKQRGNLNTHMLTHTKERPYVCHICNKGFRLRHTLEKRHMLIHTNERNYECEVCHKTFKHIDHLKSHKWSHEEKKPYACEVCNKAFAWRHVMIRHMFIHSDVRKYMCSICNKTFKYKDRLTTHMVTHGTRESYSCNICDKKFVWRHTLARHKLLHTGERKYTCKICNKAFKQHEHLMRHKWTHVENKPHVCPICRKSYINATQLKRHYKMMHSRYPHRTTVDDEYECPKCNLQFKGYDTLSRHLSHMHDTIVDFDGEDFDSGDVGSECVCPECNEQCPSQQDLLNHIMLKHPEITLVFENDENNYEEIPRVELVKENEEEVAEYICTECFAELPSEADLEDHMMLKHLDHAVAIKKPTQMDMSRHPSGDHAYGGRRKQVASLSPQTSTVQLAIRPPGAPRTKRILVSGGHAPVCCKQCQEQCHNDIEFMLHSQEHDPAPLELCRGCRICGRVFFGEHAQLDLSTHFCELRAGEQIHECKDCGRKFTLKRHLLLHRRVGEGTCSDHLVGPRDLKDLVVYACTHCGRKFAGDKELERFKKHGAICPMKDATSSNTVQDICLDEHGNIQKQNQYNEITESIVVEDNDVTCYVDI